MKTSMRKNLIAVFVAAALLVGVMFVIAPQAHAATAAELATQINGWNGGGSGALSALVSGNIVMVEGTVTGATGNLRLEVGANVNIDWRANLTGTIAGPLVELVKEGNDAEFTMHEGKIVNEGGGAIGCDIFAGGTFPYFSMEGGTLQSTSMSAVVSDMQNTTITGGILNPGEYGSGIAIGNFVPGAKITISGGTFNVKSGYAVNSQSQNVQVVFKDDAKIDITGTSGQGILVANTGCSVSIEGGMILSTKTNNNQMLVTTFESSSPVSVSGGLLFGYGPDLDDLVMAQGFAGPTGDAVMIGWSYYSTSPYPKAYASGSSTELTAYPSTIDAVWHYDEGGARHGVMYSDEPGSITGFIPLNVIVMEEPDVSGASLPGVITGQAYSYEFLPEGDFPFIFTVTGLPDGMSYAPNGNNSGVVISGTPTKAGTYSVVIKAQNSVGTDEQTFELVVRNLEPIKGNATGGVPGGGVAPGGVVPPPSVPGYYTGGGDRFMPATGQQGEVWPMLALMGVAVLAALWLAGTRKERSN